MTKEKTQKKEGDYSNRLPLSPFNENNHLQVTKAPTILYFTDTHLSPPVGTKELRFFNWKRDLTAFINSWREQISVHHDQIKERMRLLNNIANIAPPELIISGGDCCDTIEMGGFLETMTFLEESIPTSATNMIWITGNHDTSFTGPEAIFYRFLQKQGFETIPIEIYQQIINMIKNGSSWKEILSFWQNHYPDKPIIIHPALRWYLLRLYGGPNIGRYFIESENTQVVFLNSELYSDKKNITGHGSNSGTIEGLKKARKSLGLKESDSLFNEILSLLANDYQAQENTIKQMIDDNQRGIKTIIYVHDPRQIWHILAAENFNRQNTVVYCGHYHLVDEKNIQKMRKEGVEIIPVAALSRYYIGPFGQRPGTRLTQFTPLSKAYTYNPPPQVLIDALSNPQLFNLD